MFGSPPRGNECQSEMRVKPCTCEDKCTCTPTIRIKVDYMGPTDLCDTCAAEYYIRGYIREL